MLKGETMIELMDVHTGEKEEIKSENMFTNGLQNVVDGLVKLSCFNADSSSDLNKELFPIAGNLLGGIMLFSSPLEENANNICPPVSSEAECVGCANIHVNSTNDPKRGSVNKNETVNLDDGYKFVWDFGTAQGNGKIASVALTTKAGGVYGATPNRYGGFLTSPVSDSSILDNFRQLNAASAFGFNTSSDFRFSNILSIEGGDTSMTTSGLDLANILNFDCNKLCFNMAKTEIVNGKFKLFLFDCFMNFSNLKLKDSISGIQRIKNCRSCEICEVGGAFGSGTNLPAIAKHPAEPYVYLVKTTGVSTIAVAKINEPTMHLEFCKSVDISPLRFTSDTSYVWRGTSSYGDSLLATLNGYLYVTSLSGQKKGSFLKINTNNVSEMAIIVPEYPGEYYGPSYYLSLGGGLRPIYQKKRIIVPFGVIEDNKIYPSTFGDSPIRDNILIAGGLVKDVVAWLVHTSGSGRRMSVSIAANAMMTINNLPTPVTKTADKTMKITYIVRDVATV
ncbi:MAG: hypothetical protein RSD18_04855 [Anaerovoracaceae bacterium]